MTDGERTQRIIEGMMSASKPDGAVYQRSVDDTHEVVVFPSLFGAGKLCYAKKGDDWSIHFYDYPRIADAMAAAVEWDGITDPKEGWVRHYPSGRRRPDGTAASEIRRP